MTVNTPFWSQKVFEKSDKVKISYEGIARKCRVTTRSAKNYIKRDIQSGLIVRKRNKYHHPLFKKICDGRNTYILTEQGRGVIRKKPPSQPPSRGNEEKQLLFDFSKKLRTLPVSEIINQFSSKFPLWWFNDTHMLEKTLFLLQKKTKMGYNVRNPFGWISTALKDRGCGYRLKIAQEVSFHLNHPSTLENVSEPVRQFYHRLQHLKERGLDTSIPSLLKLLRKGFSHLGGALYAMEKLLKYSLTVRNLTAFLNYLTSLNDPHSTYKKEKPSESRCVETAQNLLRERASSIQFVSRESLPEKPESKKIYLEFLIHKTLRAQSFIRVFQFISGSWKEGILKVTDPYFTKNLQTLVCNH